MGAISRVGMNNIEEVIQESYHYSFELALVSAGSAAKYICSSIGARGTTDKGPVIPAKYQTKPTKPVILPKKLTAGF